MPQSLEDALDRFRLDFQVHAVVIVGPEFAAELLDQLAQGAAPLGDHLGQQQGVQKAVALRQVSLDADAPALFAADQHVARQHVLADVLEADGCDVERETVFAGELVDHRGGRKGFHPGV